MVRGRKSLPRTVPNPAANFKMVDAVWDALTNAVTFAAIVEKNLVTGAKKFLSVVTTDLMFLPKFSEYKSNNDNKSTKYFSELVLEYIFTIIYFFG